MASVFISDSHHDSSPQPQLGGNTGVPAPKCLQFTGKLERVDEDPRIVQGQDRLPTRLGKSLRESENRNLGECRQVEGAVGGWWLELDFPSS